MAVNRIARLLAHRSDMPRKKKKEERSQLATWVPKSVHDAARDYSERSGVPLSRIVEDALRAHLTRVYMEIEEDEE